MISKNKIQNKKLIMLGISLILLIIMSLFFRGFTIYIVACILIGSIVYIRHIMHLPFKIEPYLFVSIIISLGYGIGPTIFFVIVSMLIPKLIAGGEIDGSTFAYLFLFIMMNIVAINLSSINIVFLGIMFSVIDFFIISILGTTMKPEKIINGILIVGINIFLFYNFGETILTLINSAH